MWMSHNDSMGIWQRHSSELDDFLSGVAISWRSFAFLLGFVQSQNNHIDYEFKELESRHKWNTHKESECASNVCHQCVNLWNIKQHVCSYNDTSVYPPGAIWTWFHWTLLSYLTIMYGLTKVHIHFFHKKYKVTGRSPLSGHDHGILFMFLAPFTNNKNFKFSKWKITLTTTWVTFMCDKRVKKQISTTQLIPELNHKWYPLL